MANPILRRFDRLAPDVAATVTRFPVAVVLIVLGTAIWIAGINEWDIAPNETWVRLGLGLGSAAIFAVAGRLFAESHPGARIAAVVLSFAVPVLAFGLWQVTATTWLVPYALPIIALLVLSLSATPGIAAGSARRALEDRFWWMNQRAVTSAVVAGVALLIIGLGVFAIERSLELLFGLRTADLFYRWVLPIAVFLLAPVYWLSSIPKLADFDAHDLDKPDFLTRAIGFLGQFVLTPLLLIYALILIAYAAQIVMTQRFPVGVLSWLVLVFVVTGAANWLVLHPKFIRDRAFVRLFRRGWFWLTIVPIGLFGLAVWIRVDAYGLTNERVLLIAGGTWATLLTLGFLVRRFADIRLIPALAAAVLFVFSVGPWNIEQLPRLSQAARLSDALASASAAQGEPQWTAATATQARASLIYLARSEEGRSMMAGLAAEHRLAVVAGAGEGVDFTAVFKLPPEPGMGPPAGRGLMTVQAPVDVSATPVFIARVHVGVNPVTTPEGLALAVQNGELVVRPGSAPELVLPLAPWLAGQSGTELTDPIIRFSVAGRNFALLVEEAATIARPPAARPPDEDVSFIQGTLFASPVP